MTDSNIKPIRTLVFGGSVQYFVRERKIENVFENYRKYPVTIISFFVHYARKRKERRKNCYRLSTGENSNNAHGTL